MYSVTQGASSPTVARGLFWTALFFLIAAPFFWHQVEFQQGGIPEASENTELYQRIYPVMNYGFQRLRAGDVPLWNPRQRCGTPFMADPRVGLFQPLNAVFLFMPVEKALALHAMLSLFIMGMGGALLARYLGVRAIPAVLGGLCYACCGASASAMSRPELAGTLAWAPLLWLALAHTAKTRSAGTVLLAGLIGGLQLLSGAFALSVLFWLAGLVLLLLLLGERKGIAKSIKRFLFYSLLFLLTALGGSAIQWVPSLALAQSIGQPFALLGHVSFGGVAPSSLQAFFNQIIGARPGLLPRLGYLGIIPLVLMPATIVHWKLRKQSAIVLILAIGLLGSMIFIQTPLPLFAVALVFALLVALAADRLLDCGTPLHPQALWPPVLLDLIFCGLLFMLVADRARIYILVMAVVLILTLLTRRPALRTVLGLFVIATILFDLSMGSANKYRHPLQDAPKCYNRYEQALAIAEEQALGARVLISGDKHDTSATKNMGMLRRISLIIGGNVPLNPCEQAWWGALVGHDIPLPVDTTPELTLGLANPQLLNVMAMKVVLASPESPLLEGELLEAIPGLHEMSFEGPGRVFLNGAAWPRTFFSPVWRIADDINETVKMLADGSSRAVVAGDSAGLGTLENLEVPDAVELENGEPICTIENDLPEQVVVHVDTPVAGIAVLADSYAPGWRAFLDGESVPLLRINGIFRGVATPPGVHEIRYEYRPASFLVGMVVTGATLLVVILSGLYQLRRRKL